MKKTGIKAAPIIQRRRLNQQDTPYIFFDKLPSNDSAHSSQKFSSF
jgi:hypothetical protein